MPSQKLIEARKKHDEWLSKRGLHPAQLKLTAKSRKGINKIPSYKVEEALKTSNVITSGGLNNGIMANLYKEAPLVQKEILRKASRCMPLFNKGGMQYCGENEDMTKVGTRSKNL